MQTNRPPQRSPERGIALLATLALMVIILVVFASILSWVFTNATITQRNNQYNMSQNAAEAAVERVIGQIDRDFVSQSVSNTPGCYTTLPASIDQSSWPIQYTFSDTNGKSGQISVILATLATNSVPLNSQYSGLMGYAQNLDVYATATPTGQRYNVPATTHESLQLANIPLFQFAIFYNVNLEVMSGQALDIYGPVFCNQSIWEGSSIATFHSTVSAVGTNAPQVADPFSADYTGSGASIFSVAGQPVNNVNALVLPIGTNNSPGAVLGLLNLPPATLGMGTSAAYSSAGIAYPANAADLVISNAFFGTNDGNVMPNGTNFIVYYQDNGLTQLPYDFYIITNGNTQKTFATNYVSPTLLGGKTNIYFAGFSWITNVAFYDWREGWNGGSGPAKRVEALQIDVGLFSKWMTNKAYNGGSDSSSNSVNPEPTKVLHSGHNLDSIYVYNSVPLTSSQLPAVRVTDGKQLPTASGFTVATPFPMYVLNDFNVQTPAGSCLGYYGTNGSTTYTYPSALMADSVTILSDNWNDSNSSTKTTGGPSASTTTINAAMLEGIVQSNPTATGNIGMNGDYSGGVENFMRLLENWGSSTLTYNGSIVVLFYSQYATNCWRQTGNYYSAATRHWAFDLNFQNSAKLPPLTPQMKAIIRGNWYAHQ